MKRPVEIMIRPTDLEDLAAGYTLSVRDANTGELLFQGSRSPYDGTLLLTLDSVVEVIVREEKLTIPSREVN